MPFFSLGHWHCLGAKAKPPVLHACPGGFAVLAGGGVMDVIGNGHAIILLSILFVWGMAIAAMIQF
jgi:hypothetical protein